MNRLLHIGGIVLIVAAILTAVLSFTSPGQVVLGVNLGLAAVLLVGGFIVLGLAGVLSLLEEVVDVARRQTGEAGAAAPWLIPGAAQSGKPSAPAGDESELEFDELIGPREVSPARHETLAEDSPVDMEVAEEELQVEAEIGPVASASETEEVERADDRQQLAGEPAKAEEPLRAEPEAEEHRHASEADEIRESPAAGETPQPPLEAADTELDEGRDLQEEFAEYPAELYVLEERQFRGRPARLLSDGTVEAETEEGWLRFEDFDHLREYLDAMAAVQRRHS